MGGSGGGGEGASNISACAVTLPTTRTVAPRASVKEFTSPCSVATAEAAAAGVATMIEASTTVLPAVMPLRKTSAMLERPSLLASRCRNTTGTRSDGSPARVNVNRIRIW